MPCENGHCNVSQVKSNSANRYDSRDRRRETNTKDNHLCYLITFIVVFIIVTVIAINIKH